MHVKIPLFALAVILMASSWAAAQQSPSIVCNQDYYNATRYIGARNCDRTADGDIVVVFEPGPVYTNEEVWYCSYNPSTGQWNAAQQLSSSSEGATGIPCVVADGTGDILAGWKELNAGGDRDKMFSRWNGTSWSTPVVADNITNNAGVGAIDVASDGTIFNLFSIWDTGPYDANFYAGQSSDGGASWTTTNLTAIFPTPDTLPITFLDVALAPGLDGKMYAAWEDLPYETTWEVVFTEYTPSKGSWSTPTVVTPVGEPGVLKWVDGCTPVAGAQAIHEMGPAGYVLADYPAAIQYPGGGFDALSFFYNIRYVVNSPQADRDSLICQTIDWFDPGSILVVDDDNIYNHETYLYASLDSDGIVYDTFDCGDTLSGQVTDVPEYGDLSSYDLVIWFCGDDGADGTDLAFWDGQDRDNQALIDYLDGGGDLWIIGLDWLFDRYGSAPNDFSLPGVLKWVDGCTPTGNGLSVYEMGPDGYALADHSAAVYHAGAGFDLLSFLFNIRYVPNEPTAERDSLVCDVIDWFGPGSILVVDDDNRYDHQTYLYASLDSCGVAYSVLDCGDASGEVTTVPNLGDLSPYDLVIWFCGDDGSDGTDLAFWGGNDGDNQAVIDYLLGGGDLWVIGMEVLFDRYGAAPDTFQAGDFAYDYMALSSYDVQSYDDDNFQGVPQLDLAAGHAITDVDPVTWTTQSGDFCYNYLGISSYDVQSGTAVDGFEGVSQLDLVSGHAITDVDPLVWTTVGGLRQGEPSLAADSSGHAHMVYVELDHIYHTVWNGSSWSTRTLVDDSPDTVSAMRPCISIDDRDGVYVIWLQVTDLEPTIWNVFYATSTDGGATWSDAVQLSQTSEASFSGYSVRNPTIGRNVRPPIEGVFAGGADVTWVQYNSASALGFDIMYGRIPYIWSPAAPENFEVIPAGGDAYLNWDPVITNASGQPMTVDGYVVFRSDDPAAPPSDSIAFTSLSSYLDTSSGVGDTGTNSYYLIRALAGSVKSAPSSHAGEFDHALTNVK